MYEFSDKKANSDWINNRNCPECFQHELKEVEEKFRKAMILNAQLDNDKAALGYQLELLKDRIEELHEEYAQLQVISAILQKQGTYCVWLLDFERRRVLNVRDMF